MGLPFGDAKEKVVELRCSQPETLVRMYRELVYEYGELAVGSHDRAVAAVSPLRSRGSAFDPNIMKRRRWSRQKRRTER